MIAENLKNIFEEQFEEEVLKQEETAESHEIILHNDEVNTFDHVIKSLVEICEHTTVQAEQCTWLVHYKGKCSVKKGSVEELKPMCSALLDRGLSAEIN